ncbi:MAG: energy-coupling factor ABC transporter permease [Rikenellaceae bacterium]|nr:energy-coupling factor ABC transporter permease [Rikenellaceae bacterium]MBR4055236.1 energy-coupling factor ABC transporter permease [Rikenellaceae bacterium]
MHMSDTLISPAVAVATSIVAAALVVVATRKIGRENSRATTHLVPLMGVMGALIFAAQMLNFAIPATGSSGHIVGGVLLAAVLGEWAGFLTLTSVIIVQCLLFADGGLMTLGCNVLNMAALSCLVAYPLIFKPLIHNHNSPSRWATASIATSITALAMGALAVTIETELSGITALPYGRFLSFMLPIHLLIGIGEGLATAAVIASLRRYRPDLLFDSTEPTARPRTQFIAITVVAALLVASVAGTVASSRPDGLEWSIERTTAGVEIAESQSPLHHRAARIQRTTALLPDYEASMAGLVGVGATLAVGYGLSLLIRRR